MGVVSTTQTVCHKYMSFADHLHVVTYTVIHYDIVYIVLLFTAWADQSHRTHFRLHNCTTRALQQLMNDVFTGII